MRRLSLLLLACLLLAACGGSDSSDSNGGGNGGQGDEQAVAQVPGLEEAQNPVLGEFPAAKGKTLQELADEVRVQGPEAALASTVFTPGDNRVAFGLIDPEVGFIYAPTAVYVSSGGLNKPAKGPFAAPADSLLTAPAFRSKTAATETDPFAAVYEAQVPFEKPGKHAVLVVSKIERGLIVAAVEVDVVPDAKDPVPAVGEKAPSVETDTLASLGGNVELLDTREPPSDMHEQSLANVLGKRPVTLIFATPQLCQSRVCGPVVDIAAQLKGQYGDRMEFIHQEVYKDNKPDRGLRKPLEVFGLPTEPWLFTIKKDGTVAARLEGSFGFRAFERAIKAALES